MDLLDRLLEHDRWATDQLLELCRGLTDAQLDQPFDIGHRTVRALQERIRAAGREVTFHVYPGTGHWFVEPNQPDVYNAAAAKLVWDRTLAFLKTQLA